MRESLLRTAACLLLLSGLVLDLSFGQTADPGASAQTKQILQYLKNLSKGPDRRLISGHQLNTQYSPTASFDSAVTKIYHKAGQWVGLIGIDYQRSPKGLLKSMSQTNAPLIAYFRSGGLVAVMSSFTNPWTDSTMNDTTGRHKLAELVVPGTPGNLKWMQRLDSVAAGFRQLQDSGVTVLFRPLHEMNGPWFWWGSQGATLPLKQDYVALWRHMFSYFTVTKNLHNLLWAFSPSARPSSVTNPAYKADTTFYPGNEFVDIVGVDVYEDTLDIPLYDALRSTNKPFVLCEFGPGIFNSAAPGRYDYRILLRQIKTKYPEIIYWMSWNDFGSSLGSKYFGMTTHSFVQEVLTDPWVINRDRLQWRSATEVHDESESIPRSVALHQNYPNPFNPTTAVSYQLPVTSFVNLKIFDVLGREIATLADGIQGPGIRTISWDASSRPAGIYFCRLLVRNANGQARSSVLQTNKMILAK
jgi:mannan endo-1,4-beta-mannosidase